MTLYNLGEHAKSMETLLNTLVITTNHQGIKDYKKLFIITVTSSIKHGLNKKTGFYEKPVFCVILRYFVF